MGYNTHHVRRDDTRPGMDAGCLPILQYNGGGDIHYSENLRKFTLYEKMRKILFMVIFVNLHETSRYIA